MKAIELKHINEPEKRIDFDYRKQLAVIINAPIGGQGGVSVSEMRPAIKIADKLESANGFLVLEDSEWEFLNARVQAWPWPNAHRAFIEFADAVANAAAPKSPDVAGTEGAKAEAATA